MRRVIGVMKQRGVRGTVGLIVGRVLAKPRRAYRFWQEWRFDRAHGINTRGLLRDVGNEHSVIYQPLFSERAFDAALRHVDVAGRTFIDLGCGRGRVLYLARERGIERIIGVEIDERLVDDARRTAPFAEIVHADALGYEFPPPPLLVYLNNPFDGVILRQVFERLPQGDVIVVYQSPTHRVAVDGMFPVVDEQRFHVVYDARR
jgi:SAM-dependent methyltransferase